MSVALAASLRFRGPARAAMNAGDYAEISQAQDADNFEEGFGGGGRCGAGNDEGEEKRGENSGDRTTGAAYQTAERGVAKA